MTSSKPVPSSLNHYLNSTSSLHQQLGTHSTVQARPTSAFRSSPAPASRRGTDDDWGRFATTSILPESSSSAYSYPPPLPQQYQHRQEAHQDGADVMALLMSTGMTEAVEEEWEADLMRSQFEHNWKNTMENHVPVDPAGSLLQDITNGSSLSLQAKGKGRMEGGASGQPNEEDVLLSSLSSLSLLDRSYLQSLLALPSDEAISTYLAAGSYADDIYGLTPRKGALEVLHQVIDGTSDEEGKVTALRRLRMITQHLWGTTDSTHDIAAPPLSLPSSFPNQHSSRANSGGGSALHQSRPPSWMNEYPLAAQHSHRSPPAFESISSSYFQDSLPSLTQPAQHFDPMGDARGRTDGSGMGVDNYGDGRGSYDGSYEKYLRDRNLGGSSI